MCVDFRFTFVSISPLTSLWTSVSKNGILGFLVVRRRFDCKLYVGIDTIEVVKKGNFIVSFQARIRIIHITFPPLNWY